MNDYERQGKFLRDVADVSPLAAYAQMLRNLAAECEDVCEAIETESGHIRPIGSIVPGERVFYRKDTDDRVGVFLVSRRIDDRKLVLYDHDYPTVPIYMDRVFNSSPVLVVA